MSVMRVVRAAGAAIRDQYRHGLTLFVVAPVAVALIVVPEFVQHVVEIDLGMFDSREAARALANDPTRWAFGYAKLTGLVLAFLACARAVWARLESGPRWYDLRGIAWGRLVVGLALFMAVGSIAAPFSGRVDPRLVLGLNVIGTIASLPFLFLALAGLFGDRTTPWRPLLTRCWPAVALLLLLLLSGFGALQAVHMADHLLAFGRPAPLVWALMVWDSLVVGALAATTGAAFALSYRLARDRAR